MVSLLGRSKHFINALVLGLLSFYGSVDFLSYLNRDKRLLATGEQVVDAVHAYEHIGIVVCVGAPGDEYLYRLGLIFLAVSGVAGA